MKTAWFKEAGILLRYKTHF